MSKYLVPLFAMLIASPLAAQTESLLIGPGDVLHVQFYDTPELEQHPRVNDAGQVPLLFLGPVAVAGKTPEQAASSIAALTVALNYMRHPQVVVTIDQYATQDVSVTGEVLKPGSYPIATPRSVLDVLSMAGGLNAMADRHIVIRHRDPAAMPTNYFVSNDLAKALHDDVRVQPGDTILVARVGLVYVLGDVARPGGYPMVTNRAPVTLLQILAAAGSTNKTAVLSKLRLIRKTEGSYVEVPIQLDAIEKGQKPDVVLAEDDVLFIPFSYSKNFILNGSAIAASVGAAAIYAF
jgi:polysaccharide export outer membrane protein